jgi:transposase-like protein
MPWNEVSVMDQRREFVRLALQEGANRRELCRRFGISPDVGYKWLRRWRAGEAAVEARVVAVRDKHPAWGARKITIA